MNKIQLGKILQFQRGYDLTKKNIVPGKYPVITSTGIMGYHNEFKSSSSIVIGRSGTIGKPQLIKEKFWPHNTALFITDLKGNDIDYIYYLLLNLDIEKIKSGSNIPTLNRNHLHDIKVLFEDKIEIQKKISTLLKSIDKKIKLNNKINFELENMAKTIYDYWFLQFEFPNNEGKSYKSSGGKMVWNEEVKREIPDGWEVETLLKNRISSVIRTGTEYFETKNYLATANIINEEITDGNWITYENRESRANMTPVSNSVWFAKMKNSIKHLTITDSAEWFLEKYILSTGFLGLKCNENSLGYIHCFINSKYFEPKKDSLAHGATQEAVNNEDINFIKILIPKDNILESFNKIIKPLLQKKLDNKKENQELISLRDYLLPLLMNGQVGFKD